MGAGRDAAGACCALCGVEVAQAVEPEAARERKRPRGPQNVAEAPAPAPAPYATALPAAAAAAAQEAAWSAHVAHAMQQGTALALHLCTTALNQSSENHMMLAHLANEMMFLRGMCVELANQNASLAHTIAVQLARKREHRARAAQTAANATNMANNILLRDLLGGLNDGVTRGFPVGQYPDHSSSDSEFSDSEPAAPEAGHNGAGAAGGTGAAGASVEAGGC